MHIGRSFGGGGHIEASCPCSLEPCGLVDTEKVADDCDHHPPAACKTMRTGHPADECPGVGRDVVVAIGKTEAARQAVIDAAAMGEPEGWVNASLFDAIDEYRAAVQHEAAERIRMAYDEAFDAAQEVLSGSEAMAIADQLDLEVAS